MYVDDSILKSKKEENLILDLKETFENIWRHNMRLNPKKCVFGIMAGKFLGFMVSQRGIGANPAKVQTFLDLAESKSKKDVMRFTGRMAALSRFIAKSVEKYLPFFKVLRGNKNFFWEDEHKKAFQELKDHLHGLPTCMACPPWQGLSQGKL